MSKSAGMKLCFYYGRLHTFTPTHLNSKRRSWGKSQLWIHIKAFKVHMNWKYLGRQISQYPQTCGMVKLLLLLSQSNVKSWNVLKGILWGLAVISYQWSLSPCPSLFSAIDLMQIGIPTCILKRIGHKPEKESFLEGKLLFLEGIPVLGLT